MKPIERLAFVGNSLPRKCGIATFTTDLQQAVAKASRVQTSIIAMNDVGQSYEYPPFVQFQVNEGKFAEYAAAADFINSGRFDGVSLQHEFGIFGGNAGAHVTDLITRLTVPVVTTLHTILEAPTRSQFAVLNEIINVSSRIVVMSEKGRQVLESVHSTPARKIEVIPHGIPDVAFLDPHHAKDKLGFSDKSIILTFGLLSPSKGIEVVIDAMPAILKRCPDATYVVLGATHPSLVRREGETYRNSLLARVEALGLGESVVFLDQFVDKARLLEFISMCDVYVTPYINETQMTSGTLAYSFGLGRAIVSTPYWHAAGLLADGRGVLAPFGDSVAFGDEIARLLTDEPRRLRMRQRAYADSRSMTWQRTAERYLSVFQEIQAKRLPVVSSRRSPVALAIAPRAIPEMRLTHLFSMCDDTGLFQHAIHSVPDRSHGYCVDDNARALLLACCLNDPGDEPLAETLTARFASFVQHAWNPDTRRFRNFMGFDRRWLEESGSEDSHGRALWALGACARNDADSARRAWAAALFSEAAPVVESFSSPRAWAFTLIGLDGYCAASGAGMAASELRDLLAARLMSLMTQVETKSRAWFEAGLSYDNARLPQALIVAGLATKTKAHVDAGLRALRWLATQQTSPTGLFRPVGTDGFMDRHQPPRPFDQQPLEASATIDACLAAWSADGDDRWTDEAMRAFAWFLGENDLSLPLVDVETGSCRDGLHRDRTNENRGGESVVSYLLGLSAIRQMRRGMRGRNDSDLAA